MKRTPKGPTEPTNSDIEQFLRTIKWPQHVTPSEIARGAMEYWHRRTTPKRDEQWKNRKLRCSRITGGTRRNRPELPKRIAEIGERLGRMTRNDVYTDRDGISATVKSEPWYYVGRDGPFDLIRDIRAYVRATRSK